jgi:signal transduction histidine kinase
MLRFPIFYFMTLFFFISCSESQKQKAMSINKNSRILKKNSDLGDAYFENEEYDSAFYYYNKLKELSLEQNDSSYVSYSLVQLASIQHNFSDYSSVEATCVEALPFIQNTSNYAGHIYNLLGISAKETSNYRDALTYYQKAKKIAKNELETVILENNIARVYMKNNEYQMAIKTLSEVLESKDIDVLDNTKKSRTLILDNLGFSHFKNNQNQKGLDLMNQALAIRTNIGDSYGSIESYLHLAEYYQGYNIQASLQNASKAYEVASQYQSIDERLEALRFLMSYNQEKGQNKYAMQYAYLNDSITKVRNNVKNQFAKIKYDFRQENEKNLKLEAENATAELQIQKQRNQKSIFIFGMLLLIGATAYIVNYFKIKNKRERFEAIYNTETRISKKLHDELANDVFHTMTFATTQDLQNPIKKDSLIDNLEKIYNRTRNISKENNPIDTGENYENNLKEMLNSYKNDTLEVIINTGNAIEWLKIKDEKKIALYRVLQEFMVNMKKYSRANFVVIGFNVSNNTIAIEYSDNGIGTTEKLILKNGLQNAENRIQAINGTLTFETEIRKGFRAKIIFPK